MKKKLECSVSELLALRERGYSNKDIANFLEVSVATVYRYIGGQGCRMDSVTREVEVNPSPPPRRPQIQVISQTVAVGGYCFQIDTASRQVSVSLPNQAPFSIETDEIDRFTESLKQVQQFIEEM